MGFVHLHCHSCYSLLEGADWPERLVSSAKAIGMDAIALTDTNGLYGAVSFYKAALAVGIKPILGVELVSKFNLRERAVVLARDRYGYGELCRLVTSRQLNEDTFNLAISLSDSLQRVGEHIFVLCSDYSLLSKLIMTGSRENLFIDLAPFADGKHLSQLRRLGQFSRTYKLSALASNDVHFVESAGYEIHRVLSAIRFNTTTSGLLDEEVVSSDSWLKSPSEMRYSFSSFPESVIINTGMIAEKCNVRFASNKFFFPKFPLPAGETAFSYLWKLCFNGAVERYGNLTQKVLDRLVSELKVINEMGFAPYFLIVWDIAMFARHQGIPSVGRGSAANSIVSYVLKITHVEPLKHELYFERFLNPERRNCPDIDLDFCWRRRDKVLDYVYNRYGHDKVAMISTHNTFRARAAVREIGKTMGIPSREITAFTEHLPHFSAQNIDTYRSVLPELRTLPVKQEPFASIIKIAQRIDGFPRHLSIHCGGIVVSPFPLTDLVPLQRSANGLVITQYNMYPIEELGLLKIDLLGQRGLSVISDSREAAEANLGKGIDLSNSTVQNDVKTIKAIREGRTMGCFYVESPGMRGLLKKLKVTTFEALTAASSVIRPGVAESGMMRQYIDRSNGREAVTYLHPNMEKLLKNTYGVMIYQEDVIKVAHEIAGLSYGEADLLRRAMSGKGRSREAMKLMKKQFLNKSKHRGISEDIAAEIWRQIASFAGYAFCKAHSASFAQISFQSVYMKEHHPAEFMAAILSNQGGFYHTSAYLEEARRLGLKILLPDINRSQREYTGKGRKLQIGLMQFKELREETIRRILKERRKGFFVSLEDFAARLFPAAEEVRTLIKGGAFDAFQIPRTELLWRLEVIKATRKKQKNRGKKSLTNKTQGRLLFDEGGFSGYSSVIVPRMPEMSFREKLRLERQALDLIASIHPLDLYQNQLIGLDLVPAKYLSQKAGHLVKLIGWLVTTRRVKTKKGEYMRFVTMEDQTGMYELILFPKVYQKFGHLLSTSGPYLVHGFVEEDNGNFVVNGAFVKILAPSIDPFKPPITKKKIKDIS